MSGERILVVLLLASAGCMDQTAEVGIRGEIASICNGEMELPGMVRGGALPEFCNEAQPDAGTPPGDGGTEAPATCAMPGTGTAFVANAGNSSITVIDVATMSVQKTIAFSSIGLSGAPAHLAADTEKGIVYAALSNGHVAAIEYDTPRLIGDVDLCAGAAGCTAHDILLSPDKSALYVALPEANAIHHLRPPAISSDGFTDANKLGVHAREQIPDLIAPYGMDISTDGAQIVVGSRDQNATKVVFFNRNATDGTLAFNRAVELAQATFASMQPAEAQFAVGTHDAYVMAERGNITTPFASIWYVAEGQAAHYMIDRSGGDMGAPMVSVVPGDLLLNRDNTRLFFTSPSGYEIFELRTAKTGVYKGTYAVARPVSHGLARTKDGAWALGTERDGNSVTKLCIAAPMMGTTLQFVEGLSAPDGIVVD
jgi:YVTN family beta-propeller protein